MDMGILESHFSAIRNGSSVPAFVVSKFLAPFYPARHLLFVPVASLFSNPSALGGLTHVCPSVLLCGPAQLPEGIPPLTCQGLTSGGNY